MIVGSRKIKNKFHLLVVTCLVLTFTGCGGDDDNANTENQFARALDSIEQVESNTENTDALNTRPSTVVEAAIDDGRFTTLVAALEATSLDTVLNDPSATFTVFAPTDTAFAQLPEGTLEVLLAPEGLAVLSDILLYHVISDLPDAVMADVARNLAVQSSPNNEVTMANGDRVVLTFDDSMQTLMVNDSKVIITDIVTDNGIIHVLDAVLSPPEEMNPASVEEDRSERERSPICEKVLDPETRSVFQAIAEEPDLGILTALLEVTDLNEVLRNVFSDSEFTVFAPTDTAFGVFLENLGGDVADRVSEEGLDALVDIVGKESLSSILLYHVLGVTADANLALTLATNLEKDQRIVPTLNGDAVQLSSPDRERLFVNMSEVICTDIGAKNGVVHKVDAVIAFPDGLDIVHLAALKPQISSFYDLIKQTDLDHLLRASREVTVLAPTNDAFGKIPQETLDYLLSEEGRSDLIQILKQHIVIQQAVAGDVAISSETALGADGLMIETAASGVKLTVQVLGDELSIGGSTVVDVDFLSENGIIHTIDTVIVHPK